MPWAAEARSIAASSSRLSRVKQFEAGIKKGGILMDVRSRTDADSTFFKDEWKKYNAKDVYT